MNDFFDSLKDIKSQMVKEQKTTQNVAKPKKATKQNPNRDEFKDIFKDESLLDKETRLKDEFSEFIKHANVRKI